MSQASDQKSRPSADALEFTSIVTNGVALNVARTGPADGRLVILLHGFPEFWYGWRHQIAPLAEAGYRVLAPDQRGYHTSAKPEGIAAYAVDTLARDVVGLIDAAGAAKATLVGHDWGGIVAWWTAMRHPDRLDRVAILNAPHPAVLLRQASWNLAQLLRSWYVLAFQIPRLPEALLHRRDGKGLARAVRRSARPGTFTAEDLDCYRRAWLEPGALKAMIHWYRAALRARPRLPDDPRIRVPTLLIWGARDRFLGRELARPSIALCDDGRLEFIEEATHWVQHEEPVRVNRLLTDFLNQSNLYF